jgi:hypothetical protein
MDLKYKKLSFEYFSRKISKKNIIYSSVSGKKSLEHIQLNKFANYIFTQKNECNHSLISEAVSAEMIIHFLEKHQFLKINNIFSEKEIKYNHHQSKKTDYVLSVRGNTDYNIAVQVKRIHNWKENVRRPIAWNIEKIWSLLEKANVTIRESNKNVSQDYKWNIQVLHIMTSIPDVYDYIISYIKKRNYFSFDMLFITFVPKKSWWMIENYQG